jgi:hypothetical protein
MKKYRPTSQSYSVMRNKGMGDIIGTTGPLKRKLSKINKYVKQAEEIQ